MKNLQIQFAYPWLLLLIIPALFFTLLPYFRLNKRYRKTRNRICSIVLHLAVMLLSIATLAGMLFTYQIPNEQNEIIILVDKSDSEEVSQETRDEFVNSIINEGKFDDFNVGIVTFGFDQRYVLPLTKDLDDAFTTYLTAELPDVSATNVASALTYAKSLFTNPETGKIILVTDGKETDEEAKQVIRSVTAQGISVDVAFIPSSYTGADAQILGVEMPEYHISVGDECEISVNVQSNNSQAIQIALFDNDELNSQSDVQTVELEPGTRKITFKHTFLEDGLHELRFKLAFSGDDVVEQNNEYCTYHYLEVFDKLLIIERVQGESEALVAMLANSGSEVDYDCEVVDVLSDSMPKTVDELRQYDQVILNNIANADMPEGFSEILSVYVEQYGGGLFTTGGNNESGEANAYNRSDMYGSLYQEMLPVQAINYTPPIGVMVIIDRSGSMAIADDKGHSYLEGAKDGARACLDVLYERDYIGIMTLDDYQSVILELTSRTQTTKIEAAINSIEEATGGTIYTNAIRRAGVALRGLKNVAKRHIIIVSDGQPNESDATSYLKEAENFYKTDGITLSVVGVNMTKNSDAAKNMEKLVEVANGRLHIAKSAQDLVTMMREDLNAPEIKDVNEEEFNPLIYNPTSPLVQGLEVGAGEERNRLTMTLGGFYGVKKKANADLVLVGDYEVPIYAQWRYGKGMVGSFMCDLQNSAWSSDFMSDENGVRFICNVINNLMPVSNIEPSLISVNIKEDNYTNTVSVISELGEGEKIVAEISKKGSTAVASLNEVTDLSTYDTAPVLYVTSALSAENNFSRCGFVAKESGVYKIVFKKLDAKDNVLQEEVVYKSFAYSEEYDSFLETTEDDIRSALAALAEKGDGQLIEDLDDPRSIFDDFVTDLDRQFDPRFLFMILAIILFLTDIAVRKFKFKWPHEIIRDYKKKKMMQNDRK